MAELEFEVREAVVIKPGDHLIIRIAGPLSLAEAEELRARAAVLLPQLSGITVIQADQLLVFRPDACVIPEVDGRG